MRTRFIAKGGIGRAEQLARRSLIRVPASRMMMRSRLTANLNRGPEAAKHFVQRAASHPRRAAALLSMPIDPMVVAAALGPQAMAAVLEGRRVPIESQAARLCDALVRADRERVAVAMASGDPDKAMAELREAGDLGDGAHQFVDRAWKRSVPDEPDPRSRPLGLSRSDAPSVEEVWQKARVGAISPAEISPDFRAQMKAAAANEPVDLDLSAWDDFSDPAEETPDEYSGRAADPVDPVEPRSDPAELTIDSNDVLIALQYVPEPALDKFDPVDQELVVHHVAERLAQRLGVQCTQSPLSSVLQKIEVERLEDPQYSERFKSVVDRITAVQFRNTLEESISSGDVLLQVTETAMPGRLIQKDQVSRLENVTNLSLAIESSLDSAAVRSSDVRKVVGERSERALLIDLTVEELAKKLGVKCPEDVPGPGPDPLMVDRLSPIAVQLAQDQFDRTITYVEKSLAGVQPERAPDRTQERSERVDRSDGRTDRAPESPGRSPDPSAPAPDLSFDHVDALRVGARDVRDVACGLPPNTLSFSRDHFSPEDNALHLSEAVRHVLAEDLLQADPVYKDVHDPAEKAFVVHLTAARLAQRLEVKLPSGGISSPDSAVNAAIGAMMNDDAVVCWRSGENAFFCTAIEGLIDDVVDLGHCGSSSRAGRWRLRSC